MNTLSFSVRAEDTSVESNYIFCVERVTSRVNTFASAPIVTENVLGYTLALTEDSEFAYSASVPHFWTQVEFTVAREDVESTVEYYDADGVFLRSGDVSPILDLDPSYSQTDLVITVQVTAQDPEYVATYTFTFTREAVPDAGNVVDSCVTTTLDVVYPEKRYFSITLDSTQDYLNVGASLAPMLYTYDEFDLVDQSEYLQDGVHTISFTTVAFAEAKTYYIAYEANPWTQGSPSVDFAICAGQAETLVSGADFSASTVAQNQWSFYDVSVTDYYQQYYQMTIEPSNFNESEYAFVQMRGFDASPNAQTSVLITLITP